MLAGDALAHRSALLKGLPLADVIRHEALFPVVITNAPPTATDAADNDSLQQRGALVGGFRRRSAP
jgi:hypothetical protein